MKPASHAVVTLSPLLANFAVVVAGSLLSFAAVGFGCVSGAGGLVPGRVTAGGLPLNGVLVACRAGRLGDLERDRLDGLLIVGGVGGAVLHDVLAHALDRDCGLQRLAAGRVRRCASNRRSCSPLVTRYSVNATPADFFASLSATVTLPVMLGMWNAQ